MEFCEVKMESDPDPEGEENIDTLEKLQNTEGNMEQIPTHNSSKEKGDRIIFFCDICDYSGSKQALWSHRKSKHEKAEYRCDQCEYVASQISHLKQHKEAIHEGILYKCDDCDFTGSYSGLWLHKKSKHEGIMYPCDQCEFVTTTPSSLKLHRERKHEKSIYTCDQCEYVTNALPNLKQHKRSNHDLIRYPCDQCNYAATRTSDLKQHKETKHLGIRHQCDQCEYTASSNTTLTQHKNAKHKGVRYSCDHCEYSATRNYRLKNHIKSMHGVNSSVASKEKKDRKNTPDMGKCKSLTVPSQLFEPVFMETSPIRADVEPELKEEKDPLSLVKIEPAAEIDYPENNLIIVDTPTIIKQEADLLELKSNPDTVLKTEFSDS